MQKLIKNLKLIHKISIATYLAVVLIVAMLFTFYNISQYFVNVLNKSYGEQINIIEKTNLIARDLKKLDSLALQHAINSSKYKDYTDEADVILKDIADSIWFLREHHLLKRDPKAVNTLLKIQNRIVGYRQISNSLKDEIDESAEDGLYAILALASTSKILFSELDFLNQEIKKTSLVEVKKLQDDIQHIRMFAIAIILLGFFLMVYTNYRVRVVIIAEIVQLKDEILSFFDVLTGRKKQIVHINYDGADEIAEVAKVIDEHMYLAEEILDTQKREADIIKQKVQEKTSEVISLNEEIEATQREIVFTVGFIAEERSKETGYHVKRVAEYSLVLAKLYGLSLEEAMLLKNASPMHDIGKIGIPDDILNKPARFTEEEFEIMKTHSSLGYKMLKHSNKSILKVASIIARDHHEKWDGTGYPRGIKGKEIHIYARITAIADVFDALGSDRVYKKAWPLSKILEFFKEEKGKHFDPILVGLFLEHIEHILAIKENIESQEVIPIPTKECEHSND